MPSPARNNCVAEAGPAFPHSGPQVSRVWSWINGKSVCTLVDSGSTVTIIRPDMLPGDLQWCSNVRPLITVTGDQSAMLGQCTVNVQLGEQTFPYLMWVAEIQEDCLLGFDIMKDTKAVLNVDQGTVTFMDGPPLTLICDGDRCKSLQVPSSLDRPQQTTCNPVCPVVHHPKLSESLSELGVQLEPGPIFSSLGPEPFIVETETLAQVLTTPPCVDVVQDEGQAWLIPLATGAVPFK